MIKAILVALVLPPVLLLLVSMWCGWRAWRGVRAAGLAAALAALGVLLLATPAVAGLLRWSLERELASHLPAPGAAEPRAIIVLGAEVLHGAEGPVIGPMTLARLRAAAALHRRTGLPLLVTGGVLSPGDPPLAVLMARSLSDDFSTPAHWIEPRAADTRENAIFSTALLAADGLGSAHVVSHAWHLPRALEAFSRVGLVVTPQPVDRGRLPDLSVADWLPRPDHLLESWFALHEWLGRLVYAIRGRI